MVLDDADQAMKVMPTGTKSSSDSSESSSDNDGEAVTNDDSQKQTTNMRHLNLHQVMASNVGWHYTYTIHPYGSYGGVRKLLC